MLAFLGSRPSGSVTGGSQGADEGLLLQHDPIDLRPLLIGAARGDRAAFRSLYEQTSARLYGIVRRIIGNSASAEEVLQDVYLRIWERASNYDAACGEPLPWLTAIARNRAIDVLRRSKRTVAPLHDGGDLLQRLAAPSEGLDFADRDELRRCLARLDELQRQCVVLAYCDGCSREELALLFDRPVNTVKTWLHRGLNALRVCLEAA